MRTRLVHARSAEIGNLLRRVRMVSSFRSSLSARHSRPRRVSVGVSDALPGMRHAQSISRLLPKQSYYTHTDSEIYLDQRIQASLGRHVARHLQELALFYKGMRLILMEMSLTAKQIPAQNGRYWITDMACHQPSPLTI